MNFHCIRASVIQSELMDRERSTIGNLVLMSIVAYIAQLHIARGGVASVSAPSYPSLQLRKLIDRKPNARRRLMIRDKPCGLFLFSLGTWRGYITPQRRRYVSHLDLRENKYSRKCINDLLGKTFKIYIVVF